MWQVTEHKSTGRRGISPDEFEAEFLAICEAHRAQGRALAFAFILFDAQHPQLRHVMADDAYWAALDRLSGRVLSVFSFAISEEASRSLSQPFETKSMMSITRFGSELPRESLARFFPGLRLNALPAVLFFQVDAGAVVDSFAVDFAANGDPASAYNALLDVLRTATHALGQVEDESAGNAREIYNLIVQAFDGRSVKGHIVRVFRGGVKVAKAVGTLANILKLLHSIGAL